MDSSAPIIVVQKSNGKVKLCVDSQNKRIKREKFPLPTTYQRLAELYWVSIFSKLNWNSDFDQIVLHKKSQVLITPYERDYFKRLPFGISSGPEIFHREMPHFFQVTRDHLWYRQWFSNFFVTTHFTAVPKCQRPPLPMNAKTTVMLNVIRIGWFFNHKQFEEYKKQWLTFIFQSQTPWTEHEINCKTERVIINNYPA